MTWEQAMDSLEASAETNDSHLTARLSLRLYHVLLRLMIRASPYGPEARYDPLLGSFEYLVRIAATLQYRVKDNRAVGLSLEPGLIIPLWLACHRCRHRGLRHAALKILADTTRVEGMWRSDVAYKTIGTLVSVEEEFLPSIGADIYTPILMDSSSFTIPWSAWSRSQFEPPTTLSWFDGPLIPEQGRVKDLLGTTNFEERRVEIRLLMTPRDEGEPYGPMREMTIRF